MGRLALLASAFAGACWGVAAAEPLPKVWMSAQWRSPFDETVRRCAEQGVDVVEVPTWQTNVCACGLAALRRHGVKGYTSSGYELTGDVRGADPSMRGVFVGGAYRGKAIDRTLFAFEPKAYDIVIEPPVYSAVQCYRNKGVPSGHYFGRGRDFVPVGQAEIVVPERPYDGKAHVRIIPCAVEPAEPGAKPENDTVTAKMSGPEVTDRRLVRLRFDLSDCAGCCLDKVGIAVYWASDPAGEAWKSGSGQLSVFDAHMRERARERGVWRMNQWRLVNGGVFPSNEIVAVRFGDECFNLTGHLNDPACSFPLWGFSEAGRKAFAAAAPAGCVQPRTWGFPEVYGAEAYGLSLYLYHKTAASIVAAFRAGVKSVAPSVLVFRNTTRGDVWCEVNDHDGSGQELLTRELDFVHLDPYPVGRKYNDFVIPFDMGYMSGLARRYGKPLLPWMQAHAYRPCGLGNIKPADIGRMWAQHAPFAPDAIMWLGYDAQPGNSDTEMTFPHGSPESWAAAKTFHARLHGMPERRRPTPTLAVVRSYAARALCCAQGAAWAAWRNPADRMLRAYVEAWSVDNGLFYDVFEVPPCETAAERAAREAELAKYPHVVATMPCPRARIIGEGTEGTVMKLPEMSALRKKFDAEIKALLAAEPGLRSDSDRIEAMVAEATAKGGSRTVTLGRNAARADGVWLVERAILVPSDFTLVLDGCRVELAPGTRDNIIRNAGAAATRLVEPDRNIRIVGRNGAVLCGGKDNHWAPNRSGDVNGWPTVGILFAGVTDYEIGGFAMEETQCWGISQELGCARGRVHDICFRDTNKMRNQDGIDVRKGCHDIVIENITGACGDDVVALTALRKPADFACPKGRVSMQITGPWATDSDDVYNVTIRNIRARCSGGHGVIRLLVQDGIKMHHVSVSNVVDTTDVAKGEPRCQAVIRVGDVSYWTICRNAIGDLHDVTVSDVVSRGKTAVWIHGPLADARFERISTPEGGKRFDVTAPLERVKLDEP